MEDRTSPTIPVVTAKSALAAIIDTEKESEVNFIFEQSADISIAPASITKLLTALTAIKIVLHNNISPVTSLKVIDSDDVEGSGRNLKTGDQLSLLDCLANLLISSSNISANVIAREIGTILHNRNPAIARGPIDRFIVEMNTVARRLNMRRSNFVNPHGLPDKAQRSTTRDLYHLVRKCSDNVIIRGLWGKPCYKISVQGKNARDLDIQSIFIFSTLAAVPSLHIPYFRGGKSGTLWPSYFNLAAISDVNPRKQLITITAGSPTVQDRYNDYLSLVDFGRSTTSIEPSPLQPPLSE